MECRNGGVRFGEHSGSGGARPLTRSHVRNDNMNGSRLRDVTFGLFVLALADICFDEKSQCVDSMCWDDEKGEVAWTQYVM